MQDNIPNGSDSSTGFNRRTFLKAGIASGALVATPGQLKPALETNDPKPKPDQSSTDDDPNRGDPSDFSGEVERLRVNSFDDVELSVEIYIPENTDLSATTYMVANNWSYQDRDAVREARALAVTGNRVVKYDARGYGKSGGTRESGLETANERSQSGSQTGGQSNGDGLSPVLNANFADAQSVIKTLQDRDLVRGSPSSAI